MEIFDISPDVLVAPVYEGDPKPKLKQLSSIDENCEYNLSQINMCLHTGSHIDAPYHFVKDGKTIDEVSLNSFVGECTVISLNENITLHWISKIPKNCKKLLIKSNGNFCVDYKSALELTKLNLNLIGIDGLSISNEEDEKIVHEIFGKNNIAILECIDLKEVKDGDYFLVAPALKIGGAEAAPCRALLIKF